MGLGTWAMGSDEWAHGWGPQDEQASLATIERAIDLGMNWIDTAPVYGLGHAESVVGRALKGHPDILIASKCGLVWEPGEHTYRCCLEAESISREVEGSLRRLQREAIDLYQIHWPTPKADLSGAWDAMGDLIAAGKIRYAGLCNVNIDQIAALNERRSVATVQLPYNMIERGNEKESFGFCGRLGIGVLAYAPMRAGLLSGTMTAARVAGFPATDWRRASRDFQAPLLQINLELVEALRGIAERLSTSVAQLAVAWVLRREEIGAAIVGARHGGQIRETAGAVGLQIPGSEIAEIDRLLVRRDERLRELRARRRRT